MSIFTDIDKMLVSHLNSMVGLPAVAWENKPYTPVLGTLYIRPTNLSGETYQASLGVNGTDGHVGIYQVDVFIEIDKGRKEALTMADKIADHFKRGTYLSFNNRALRTKNVSRQVFTNNNDGWLMLAVEISYIAITEARV